MFFFIYDLDGASLPFDPSALVKKYETTLKTTQNKNSNA